MIALQVTKKTASGLTTSHMSRVAVKSLCATSSCFSTLTTEDLEEDEEEDTTSQHVERGFLFSAPCLDPEIRKDILERRGVENACKTTVSRVEKGILFSAPCLDMDRDGEYRILKEAVTAQLEKTYEVFRHPRDPASWTFQPRF